MDDRPLISVCPGCGQERMRWDYAEGALVCEICTSQRDADEARAEHEAQRLSHK